MQPTTRALIAASLVLAVAAFAPMGEAAPFTVCTDATGCHTVHAGPEPGASCTASGDGSGIRVGCRGS